MTDRLDLDRPAARAGRQATDMAPGSAAGWDRMQREYWDNVAGNYASLYRDGWSRRENDAVVARLRTHLPKTTTTLLDLGCGPGLGAALVARALGRELDYHGIDISPAMIEACRSAHPGAALWQGTMTDLALLDGARFDAVTAFYATGSYASSLDRLLEAASSVLADDGTLYISFVNRWSLRRLSRGRFAQLERYHTRREHDLSPPLIRAYSRSDLRAALAQRPELALVVLEGEGALAGVAEREWLWPLSARLDRFAPGCSHLLEVVLRKRSTA